MSKSLCGLGVRCLGSVGGSLRRDVRPTGMDVNKKDALLDAGLRKEGSRVVMVPQSPRQKVMDHRGAWSHVMSHPAKTEHPAKLGMATGYGMARPKAMRI